MRLEFMSHEPRTEKCKLDSSHPNHRWETFTIFSSCRNSDLWDGCPSDSSPLKHRWGVQRRDSCRMSGKTEGGDVRFVRDARITGAQNVLKSRAVRVGRDAYVKLSVARASSSRMCKSQSLHMKKLNMDESRLHVVLECESITATVDIFHVQVDF